MIETSPNPSTTRILDHMARLEALLVAQPHLLRTADEYGLQGLVERRLCELALPFDREFRGLGRADRPDFFLSDFGWVIEVKLRYPKHQVFRQIGRYLKHGAVKGVALISARHCGLPTMLEGKPIREFAIWRVFAL